MYKQASKLKLKFNTTRGVLTTEQLWDLPINELDALAVELDDAYNKSGKKSFLTTRSVKDKELKLKLDIVVDILGTKVEDQAAAAEAAENKEFDKKILAIIADKQDESLKGKSITQLKAMLKNRD